MAFYYARIWIEITPLRIRWWPDRDLAQPPQEWRAPADVELPASDPGPTRKALPAWRDPPGDWRPIVERSLDRLPLADLTVADEDGFPLCVPVSTSGLDGELIRLRIGSGAPDLHSGPACLTLHDHATKFTGQENHTLMGSLEHRGDETGLPGRAGPRRLEPGGRQARRDGLLPLGATGTLATARSRSCQARARRFRRYVSV